MPYQGSCVSLYPSSLGERNASKKQDRVIPGALSSFFSSFMPHKKHRQHQKSFKSGAIDHEEITTP